MATRRLIPPQDAMFLWGESNETMMHVASLTTYTPPEDAGPSFLKDLHDSMREAKVAAPWNQKLRYPHLLRHPRQAWVEDDRFDIDYHVRRSALPSPGDERELGVVMSRLHSHQLDFSRPPWELHLVEGLEGGRFAIYFKVHHSLVDGYSGVKLQAKSMSTDPDERDKPFLFSVTAAEKPGRGSSGQGSGGLTGRVTGAVGAVGAKARGAVRLGENLAGAGLSTTKAIAKLELGRGESTSDLVNPLRAPQTVLNARTGRNRRLATQLIELDRLKAVAKASGGTLNDVVMAMCGGALRRFLGELDELPDKPLIAFIPVNIRPEGDAGGGNMVGATLASMGTHLPDPKQRMEAVIASTTQAKDQMRDMKQLAALAYSGYLLAPAGLQVLGAFADVRRVMPTTFNLCISNLPGPREPLYLRGARAEAIYPMSIPTHGMALNITLESYAGNLCFGFIGCRDAVPSLQKLAVYTGEELGALEEAYGLAP